MGCCEKVEGSGGDVEPGAVAVAVVVTGIVVVSGGSESASSSCPELEVGWPVDIESTILSLGVGIISDRMSSPSVLTSSSSSLIATYYTVSINPSIGHIIRSLLVSSLLAGPGVLLAAPFSHSGLLVLRPVDLGL